MRIVVFILFTSFFSYGIQAQKIQGVILDSLLNTPLQYANISILHTNYGTSSDSLGRFVLEVKKHKTDTLFISMLGYNTQKVLINTILKEGVNQFNILLSEKKTSLDEVLLAFKKKKYTKSKTLGVKRKKIKFKSSVPFGYERCLLIKNEKAINGKVKAIAIKFKKREEGEYDVLPAYFRVKFYKFNIEKNQPGIPIPAFDTIIKPQNKNHTVTLKVEDAVIPFFKSGICVSIEAINPHPLNPKNSMYTTAPNLVMTYDDEALTWTSFRGQPWTHNTRKMKWKAFGKTSFYYSNPLVELQVQFEK